MGLRCSGVQVEALLNAEGRQNAQSPIKTNCLTGIIQKAMQIFSLGDGKF